MIIIYLYLRSQIGEVCRNVVNDQIQINFCDNMDVIGRLARDLENEGIELSNEKILKIMIALSQCVKVFYRTYIKKLQEQQSQREGEEAKEVQTPQAIIEELSERL